jgi:hypothetical protein
MNGKRTLLIAICLGTFLLGVLFLLYGYDNTWRLWNIPTMSPAFADIRAITGAAYSYALGYDPLVYNPGDPWGRIMNYPRIWQLLCALGIDQSYTILIGVLFATLFIAGIFLYLPKTIDNATAYILISAVFSPAVLLGIERGNTDLLVFFLLSITISLFSMNSKLLAATGFASLLFAFILKLYPLFGSLIVVRTKSRMIKFGASLLTVAIFYAALTFNDLQLIHRATPKSTSLSYGINVLWMFVHTYYGPFLGDIARIFTYIAVSACFILGVSVLFVKKYAKNDDNENSHQQSLDAFRLGSGIYMGTFVLGNNWDYRLVFLLFAIPQLVHWATAFANSISWIARMLIICILLSMWHLVIRYIVDNIYGYLLDELANWIIFYGLAYLTAYSAPGWLKERCTMRRHFHATETRI